MACSTTAYVGRQRQTQDLEAAVQEKTRILTRMYQRDNRLLWALVVTHDPAAALRGSATSGRAARACRKCPMCVLVDHLGNHAPLLKLADLPVTPEQSIIVGTLMTWLEHVRMISSDSVVLGKNWERVEDYTSQAALQQLEGFRREQKQRQQLGRRVEISPPRVMPDPESPVPIPRRGKRRPTIRTDSCCPTSRAGGRPP